MTATLAIDDTRDALPGMAFQIRRVGRSRASFAYIGPQSLPLLGIAPDDLARDPAQFVSRVIESDRAAYAERLAEAEGGHLSFNWEGRIAVPGWDDEKWLDVRVTERRDGETALWDGLILNVTQGKRLKDALLQSRQELARLAVHAESQREFERAVLARALTDDLGGNLAALRIGLGWIAERSSGAVAERAHYLDGVVGHTLAAAEKLVHDLRPPILDLGLIEAIRWLVERIGQTSGLRTAFQSDLPYIELAPESVTGVFRIAEEALTNVVQHARASRVALRLLREPGALQLDIVDNGVGFPAEFGARFGLAIMAERATSLGGTLDTVANPGGGARVVLRLPLPGNANPVSQPD